MMTEYRNILTNLLLVFIIFKLTGDINWSWSFVLFPLWIGIGISILRMSGMKIFNWWIKRKYVYEKQN